MAKKPKPYEPSKVRFGQLCPRFAAPGHMLADRERYSSVSLETTGSREVIGVRMGRQSLVTTIIGVTGLWPAVLADTGATVLVTMNALRLLRPFH
ncbi:hypothetical protein G6L41_026530 (plasmid) [Agrobacterium tumefaciens]|uniref:Uncharacterized protein n=3 Tax=Rhizobium/Agrobacterium group TaxID=227290 RepID=A0AAJ4N9Z0_AGRTU|nr:MULTISPECIES: hypothetical protein [Agrobacterium tumefaciens complex]MBO0134114.1 hypothetical protein [Agrobacterium burrii]NSY51507.1 hypothetical protein [Agrobacterium tumefaciens]QTG17392.1 hypothetical protein G6M86_29325 [Agrobacterium tumefaciens]WCJ66209.1 hypothetical protein G6M15_24875 [Agrobacterium tumefaciens]WCK17271.1 hypothetical protein G6L41_026530 [Agrobacterium tumefaciens]